MPYSNIPFVPFREVPMYESQPPRDRMTRVWVIFFEQLQKAVQEASAGLPCIGWDVQDSTPASDVSDPVIPPTSMVVTSCRVRIKNTDVANAFEFDLRLNGASIFAERPVIAAGTNSRDVLVFDTFVASPLVIQADDDLILDVLQGGDWQGAIYLVGSAEGSTTAAGGTSGGTGGGGGGTTDGGGTVTHITGVLTLDQPVFGNGGADIKVGTKSGNTTEVATVSGALTAGHFLTADASGNVVDGGADPLTTAPVTSVAGKTGAVLLDESDVADLITDLAALAPLASPALTGTPTAPTAAPGTNTTQIATTAFVEGEIAGITGGTLPSSEPGAANNFLTAYDAVTGLFSKAQPVEADVANLVTDLAAKAPLASPALTGTPTAPTAAPGTDTTQIATTAFVEQELGVSGSGAYFAWGGDGSDGAVVFDGAATILGLAPSSSVYTLTRDICCTNLTVNSGVTIKTANYAIFCTGTCTVNGTIHNDGQTGSNGGSPTSSTGGNGGTAGIRTSNAAGTAGHYGLLIAPVSGTAGGNGTTTAGAQAPVANAGAGITGSPVDQNGSAGVTGSSGGKGGTGTSGAGGAARTGGPLGSAFTYTSPWQAAKNAAIAICGASLNFVTTASVKLVQASNACNGGAAGGSGGGGDGTNAGGGGGGGGGEGGSGGVLGIFAHTITIGATGIVRANGGTGGNGGNGRTQTAGNVGGGGGGAGGSGGVGGIVWLVYHRLTNSGTVQAIGGTHGTGGTKGSPHGTGTDDAANGADGTDGPLGNVVYIPC